MDGRLQVFTNPGSSTFDQVLVTQNQRQCARLVQVLRNEIYVMQFEAAQKNLSYLEELLNATNKILDEDSQIPSSQLVRDSVLDVDYVPREAMPNLRGAALRAAIGGELAFSERLHIRAGIVGPFAGSAPPTRIDATPCTDSRDQATKAELEWENKLGFVSSSDFGAPNSYFSMARVELGLLHYSVAHDLAIDAYSNAQKALSVCSTPFGNSNPASVVVSSSTVTTARTDSKTEHVNISAAAAASLLEKMVPPVFPPLARAAGVSGTVVLRVRISDAGAVESISVISGPAMLQDSATAAVRRWHYKPYVSSGEPTPVETTVNVVFAPGR